MAELTAQERSRLLVADWLADWVGRTGHQFLSNEGLGALRDLIYQAIIAHSNDELMKRRALEAQLSNIQAGGPVIESTAHGAALRVFNQVTRSWWHVTLLPENGADAVVDLRGRNASSQIEQAHN